MSPGFAPLYIIFITLCLGIKKKQMEGEITAYFAVLFVQCNVIVSINSARIGPPDADTVNCTEGEGALSFNQLDAMPRDENEEVDIPDSKACKEKCRMTGTVD